MSILLLLVPILAGCNGGQRSSEPAGEALCLSGNGWTLTGVATVLPRGDCLADCDGSGTLSPSDFSCYLERYAQGDARADCGDLAQGVHLDIDDFVCFMQRYAAGCP